MHAAVMLCRRGWHSLKNGCKHHGAVQRPACDDTPDRVDLQRITVERLLDNF